jgi:uroporphyrinogen-III synthase
MKGRTVAILESRMGAQLTDLVARRGGVPLHAPALAEIADLDPAAIRELIEGCRQDPARAVIFQTGVGTRALFDATDKLGLTEEFLRMLERTEVVVRGPKPTGVLRGRGVKIQRGAADPFTTTEVLQLIEDMDLRNSRVLVQSYGEPNRALDEALEKRGARVTEIPTYRWALPADVRPLQDLMDALQQGRVDAVLFTSASQIRNLCEVARGLGREAALVQDLNGTLVASVGPVCSEALRSRGIRVAVEASPPKLGPLMAAVEAALGQSTTN